MTSLLRTEVVVLSLIRCSQLIWLGTGGTGG